MARYKKKTDKQINPRIAETLRRNSNECRQAIGIDGKTHKHFIKCMAHNQRSDSPEDVERGSFDCTGENQ